MWKTNSIDKWSIIMYNRVFNKIKDNGRFVFIEYCCRLAIEIKNIYWTWNRSTLWWLNEKSLNFEGLLSDRKEKTSYTIVRVTVTFIWQKKIQELSSFAKFCHKRD